VSSTLFRMALARIVPYDANWPRKFDAIAADIRRALGPLARRIDHIGSTAVPGLAAKDVIDARTGWHPGPSDG